MTAFWIEDSQTSGSTAQVSGNAITVPVPTGYQEGDILLLVASTANENFATIPPSGGWADVPNPPVGFGTAGAAGGLKMFVWWKRAGASESSVSLGDAGSYNIGVMFAIRNADESANPFESTSTQNNTTATTSAPIPGSLAFSHAEGGLACMFVAGDADTATALTISGTFTGSNRTNTAVSTATSTGAGGGLAGRFVRRNTSGTLTINAQTLNSSQTSSGWTGIIKSKKDSDQNVFRFRNDNGSQTTATWLANANVNASTTTISGDTTYRIRFSVDAGIGVAGFKPILQFSTGSANNDNKFDLTKYTQLTTVREADTVNNLIRVLAFGNNGAHLYNRGSTGSSNGVPFSYLERFNTVRPYDPVGVTKQNNTDLNLEVAIPGINLNAVSIAFNPAGTKLFLLREEVIYQATLSTPWFVHTAGAWTNSGQLGVASVNSTDLLFSNDGTRVLWRRSTTVICSRSLSTAYDITTATGSTVTLTVPSSNAFIMRNDGLRCLIGDTQYNLSTAWNITTATATSNKLKIYDGLVGAGNTRNSNVDLGFFWPIDDGEFILNTSSGRFQSRECDLYTWTDVTTSSSPVRAVDSANLVHESSTTQQITSGGTFLTPNSGVSETGTAGGANGMSFAATPSIVEVEYTIQIIHSAVNNGDQIRFRLKNTNTRTFR